MSEIVTLTLTKEEYETLKATLNAVLEKIKTVQRKEKKNKKRGR